MNLWLASEVSQRPYLFPFWLPADPVFGGSPVLLFYMVFMCMVILAPVRSEGAAIEKLYCLQTTSCWSLWKVMCWDGAENLGAVDARTQGWAL